MPDRILGPLVRLQVQRDPLKVKGVGYRPEGIVEVATAVIGPLGIVGRHNETWVVDAHHAAHPQARGAGSRALSIGFTGHYDRMAERFGGAPVGCAGENLIVDSEHRFMESDLSGTLIVRTEAGELPLRNARVAAPCAEFTSWIKGLDVVLPQREQPEDIAFLHDGMRGFILDVAHLERPMIVRVGDEVVLRK